MGIFLNSNIQPFIVLYVPYFRLLTYIMVSVTFAEKKKRNKVYSVTFEYHRIYQKKAKEYLRQKVVFQKNQ